MSEGGENIVTNQIANIAQKAQKLGIDTKEKNDDQLTSEIIEFRNNQSNISRLAENLTGFRPDNPKIIDLLVPEAEKIRDKYGLPNPTLMIINQKKYHNLLNNYIKENNIQIFHASGNEQFFVDNPNFPGAFFPETNSIVVNQDFFDDSPGHDKTMLFVLLAHEITHAKQFENEPNMSIEQKEYEANMASLPIEYLYSTKEKEEKLNIVKDMFSTINESVELCDKQGEEVTREWYTPDNLLIKIDGITKEQIDTHNTPIQNVSK
jgi:hypothetical protein